MADACRAPEAAVPGNHATMTNDRQKDSPRLYNSRIVDTYIRLIKRKYRDVDISQLLADAGMTSYEVADQGHWFTQEQIDRFHNRLVQLTGNENIARDAGRYSASPEAIGVMRQYILGMVSPARVFQLIGKAASNFSRSAVYIPRVLASNQVEITVCPHPGTQEKPFQCENRIGFFDAVSLIFNNKLPHIEHPECLFQGDAVCRYMISWEKTVSDLWRKIRKVIMLVMVLAGMGLLLTQHHLALLVLALMSLTTLLGFMAVIESQEKRELKASLENLVDSGEKLVDQMNLTYNNALMTNEIGQAVSHQLSIEGILDAVINIFQKRLDYDRGLILLADDGSTRLEFRAGYGYNAKELEMLNAHRFRLDRPDSQGVFVVSFKEQKPFLINDIQDIGDTLSLRSRLYAEKLRSRAFICCPIVCDGKSIGILAVDNIKSKRVLVQSDMSLLLGITHVIGISIRNSQLLEARMRQFKSIVEVLAASIDARDPLTAGHSKKVTEYALGICREMGFDTDYQEMIRVAALLHDYGKIGVPDAILKKEGRLTADEYETVKTHTAQTRQILEQVNFEGAFGQVPTVAAAHHEKMDGSGYPEGLVGEQIPLGARIIAVADFFEAITATRHYRGPMPLEVAFDLLQKRSGQHFDPVVVQAFLSFYEKTQGRVPVSSPGRQSMA
jgi:HD-GYP domain-containing protein (c-di-GMP phosphodiesterase class II)